MTYAIYYINPQSLAVTVLNFYAKYDMAIKWLKSDAEHFVKMGKNVAEVKYINKKKEMPKENGYYLKMSNKYPNRINVYERTSRDIGYIMSNIVVDIKKIYVFSLLSLELMPDSANISDNISEVGKAILPKVEMLFMDELKEKLKNKVIL